MCDHIKKGSSYMSMRKLCCPRRWLFGKDVASLHHGRYDPLSHYGDLALKNVLPVYILPSGHLNNCTPRFRSNQDVYQPGSCSKTCIGYNPTCSTHPSSQC